MADAAPTAPAAWFERRVKRGLAALLTLRLEGHPPADVVEATARVWAQALWPGRAWDEARDGGRIGEAYRLIALQETRWPTPAVLLRYLPPRPAVPALRPPPVDAASYARARAALAEVAQRLRADRLQREVVRLAREFEAKAVAAAAANADPPTQTETDDDPRGPDRTQ